MSTVEEQTVFDFETFPYFTISFLKFDELNRPDSRVGALDLSVSPQPHRRLRDVISLISVIIGRHRATRCAPQFTLRESHRRQNDFLWPLASVLAVTRSLRSERLMLAVSH